jgi:UTP--glucose-1-phosphate uridylyltransferase
MYVNEVKTPMSSEKPIRTAIIPAAGLGTRFLPATKSVPKELLPIVDTPTLQYIVQEVHEAGIETLILVTGRGKSSIIDHFDLNEALEEKLKRDGKEDLAQRLHEQCSLVRIVAIRQQSPKGLGHAVLCAKHIVGDEPFAVLLGDDLVDSKVPCTKQMINEYQKYGQSIVALMEVAQEDVNKFGICAGTPLSERSLQLHTMVEKPPISEAPSRLAIVGRYILTPRIFKILEETQPGRGGEIQLTDAMATLMKEEGFIGYQFEGQRFDAGDKFGFIQANIFYAMKNPAIRPKLLQYMQGLVNQD